MAVNPEVIARAALRLLDEVGLDGLTMRMIATELDVRAPTLYWHVKNKQELLDAMATLICTEATDTLQPPAADADWVDWLREHLRHLRRTMLRYRDGARICAGTHVSHPRALGSAEMALKVLRTAGFSAPIAAHGMSTLTHYAVGFTIEEQARQGHSYAGRNPYDAALLANVMDPNRLPFVHEAMPHLFDSRADTAFDTGLEFILTGLRAELDNQDEGTFRSPDT